MKTILKIIITIVVGFIGFLIIPGILMEQTRSPNVFINIIIWGITGAFLVGVWRYGKTKTPNDDKHQLRKD